MSVVEIEDVGAIEAIAFDLPDDRGGVKLFVGDNGRGKTTALLCLQGLLGAKTSLSPREGSDGGQVSGMGRRLKVNKRQSVTGATKVPHLGSRLDVGKLVEPGVLDPKSRDKSRIRALVSLCQSQVKPSELVSEDLQQYIDMDGASDIDDPVRMADFMKRAIDRAALDEEKRADVKAELAKAKRVEAGDVDELDKAGDMQSLAAEHRAAISALSDKGREIELYAKAEERNKQAQDKVESLEAKWDGVPIDEAKAKKAAIDKVVDGLREDLRKAEDAAARAAEVLAASENHHSRLSELKSLVKPLGDKPVDNRVELEAKAKAAYDLLLGAEKIKDRKRALEESKSLQDESVKIAKAAELLRAESVGLQAKIQSLLPDGPIQIVDGELKVEHERRGKFVPYDELSEGERWAIALGYAIRVVGEGGVIPVTQESWQSLGESARRKVLEVCRENKVWLISAQVENCDLTVVEYE